MKHADLQKRLYHKPINGNYGNRQLKTLQPDLESIEIKL